ncbi:MAG TPA: hypothetical protein VKA03_03835 [Methylovirgula sp.]|nr:hypothetical protein [Methylovirgula sp.]
MADALIKAIIFGLKSSDLSIVQRAFDFPSNDHGNQEQRNNDPRRTRDERPLIVPKLNGELVVPLASLLWELSVAS